MSRVRPDAPLGKLPSPQTHDTLANPIQFSADKETETTEVHPERSFISPLFFQYAGHSKVLVGYERTSTDTYLIMLDPSSLTQIHHLPSVPASLVSLRHSITRIGMYHSRVQVLYVDGDYLLDETETAQSVKPRARQMGDEI